MSDAVRYWMKFCKGEEVKYISHLDLMRTLQRSISRAKLPIIFSEGYNPHPRLSLGPALKLGITSESEFFEIILRHDIEPEALISRLNKSMPSGLSVIEARRVPSNARSLSALIELASYKMKVSVEAQNDFFRFSKAIDEIKDLDKIIVKKKNKKGEKNIDIKPLIRKMIIQNKMGDIIYLEMVLSTGSKGNVRPDQIWELLNERYNSSNNFSLKNIHRTGLYSLKDGEKISPMKYY